MNTFEQVSSGGHQMSLRGGPCPVRSNVEGWGSPYNEANCLGGSVSGESLYSEVQCISGNDHM